MQGQVEDNLQINKGLPVSFPKLAEKEEKTGIKVMANEVLDKTGFRGLFIGIHVIHSITPANMAGYLSLSSLFGTDDVRMLVSPEFWQNEMLQQSKCDFDWDNDYPDYSVTFSISTHAVTDPFDNVVVYSFAIICIRRLCENRTLEEMIEVSEEYVSAFLKALTVRKQGPYRTNAMPEMVYVTINQQQPLYMAYAFRDPVIDDGEGYGASAVDSFCKYIKYIKEEEVWYTAPVKELYVCNERREILGEKVNYESIPKSLGYTLKSILSDTKCNKCSH